MRKVPGCIHISKLTTILDHFDAVNQIFPTLSTDDNEADTNECDTYADKTIEVRKGLFCIITEHSHGVVDVSKEAKCLTCGSTLKVKCIHLQKLSSHHEELCQTSGSTRPSSYESKCLSVRKIPFISSTLMQAEYDKPFKERFRYDGEDVVLVPDNHLCDVCSCRLQETSSNIEANICGVHQILGAKIFSKTCMACKKTFHLDGLEQCVLNMGQYIMCHEVLRRFMYYFLSGKDKERTLFSRTVRSFLLDLTSRGISLEQKGKLLQTVQEENQSSKLLSFLNVILEDCINKGDRIVAKGYWRELIKALASSNPFCSFLVPSEDLFDFLNCSLAKHVSIFEDDTTLSRIQKEVPVFFNLLSHLKETFPFDALKESLPYFKQKVVDPFVKKSWPSELPNEADIDELAFFPQLRLVRKRGTFVADTKGSKLKDICSKFAKGHPHLLPGVFTLFCLHGICYGFQVMKIQESPDVPFTLLRTRFRKAPKLVVYDNACSLHVYSLNRDPVFFKDISFQVDSLHFRNHTASGPSYEQKAYPQYCKLNSQVVEQSNSRLQRLKGSLSYMTQHNFMKHCKFYLWGQNQEILSKNKDAAHNP